ncbi:hypothetical protein FQR65_LT20493 [Abscondita terminalis]|nr:hypothetical protein FQR65_LT20493 [Abscondita terminalis]
MAASSSYTGGVPSTEAAAWLRPAGGFSSGGFSFGGVDGFEAEAIGSARRRFRRWFWRRSSARVFGEGGGFGGGTTVQKHIYVHVPPPEPEEFRPQRPIPVGQSQKHYKIIFIKAPSPPAPTAPIIPVQTAKRREDFGLRGHAVEEAEAIEIDIQSEQLVAALTSDVRIEVEEEINDQPSVVENKVSVVSENHTTPQKCKSRKSAPKKLENLITTTTAATEFKDYLKEKMELKRWYYDEQLKFLATNIDLQKKQIEILQTIADNISK